MGANNQSISHSIFLLLNKVFAVKCCLCSVCIFCDTWHENKSDYSFNECYHQSGSIFTEFSWLNNIHRIVQSMNRFSLLCFILIDIVFQVSHRFVFPILAIIYDNYFIAFNTKAEKFIEFTWWKRKHTRNECSLKSKHSSALNDVNYSFTVIISAIQSCIELKCYNIIPNDAFATIFLRQQKASDSYLCFETVRDFF